MNKKFYFGLALTAGLFASCSSDDVTTSEARQIAAIDDNAPAKVELNVGSIGATVDTRGTGSVGIAADGTTGYGWAGQTFNAFMLEKGTMKYAHMNYQVTTSPFVFKDDPTDPTGLVKNGKGAEFTTPDQNGAGGTTPVGLTTGLEVYYPTLGEYDFWAYRLDDAYKGGAITGYDDATANAIEIPFEIDGTQDIMVAAVTADYGGLTPAEQTECEPKLYSAFTGRRGVKAQLDFKHQLTRLTFKVKAHTKDVSDAADLLPGAAYKGFKVTGISVRSNTTGKLVAASTGAWDPEAAITWDAANWATPAGLTELQLKSRAYGVAQKATGNFVAVNLGTATIGTTTLVTTYHGTVTVTNDMIAYETQDKNANTGVPSSTKKTIAEWIAAGTPTTVYFWDEDAAYLPDYADVNINENLQTLIPVQPKWNVAIHTETTLFTIPTGVVNVADDADIATKLAGQGAADYTVLQADDRSYYTVTWDGTAVTAKSDALYTVPTSTAPTPVADMAALNAIQDDAAATGVTVFLVGTTKYIKSSVTAAKPAAEAAVATPVGEALMVAPADENGYLVTVYYSCFVKDNATTSHEKTDGVVSKQIVLKKKTGQQDAQPFKAGKQYNITIELFRNATAESTTTVTDWGNDDDNELEDSYNFE